MVPGPSEAWSGGHDQNPTPQRALWRVCSSLGRGSAGQWLLSWEGSGGPQNEEALPHLFATCLRCSCDEWHTCSFITKRVGAPGHCEFLQQWMLPGKAVINIWTSERVLSLLRLGSRGPAYFFKTTARPPCQCSLVVTT